MPPRTTQTRQRYGKQRAKVSIPVVPLSTLRKARGLTLEDVCSVVEDETGRRPERGTISAIERGLRGASREMLHAIAIALDVDPDLIDTKYEPRRQPLIPHTAA